MVKILRYYNSEVNLWRPLFRLNVDIPFIAVNFNVTPPPLATSGHIGQC